MRRATAPLLLLALAAGCADGHFVSTRLQTSYRHGFQFVLARVELVRVSDGAVAHARDVTFSPDPGLDLALLSGRSLADFEGVATGVYDVRVTLLDARGGAVDDGVTRVAIEDDRSVLVGVSAACASLSCPTASDPADATACSLGRCVPPSCLEDPEGCVERECGSDAECAGTSACAAGQCVGERCLAVPDDALCAADEFCEATLGCQPRPEPLEPDASTPPPDAGPTPCSPSDCDDGDPCTTHACVAGSCQTSPRCGAGEYCDRGACHPEPTFMLQTSGAPDCIDLGVAHTAPDFTFRRIIEGRPNRTAVQTNQQVSCGDPPRDDPASFPLGPDGRWEDTFESGAVTDCDFGIYGRWQAYVTVDGRRSNTVETVYYNSGCPAVATCVAARSFCSPCRACTESQYCYASSSCAPNPTIRIDTASGPGCVDLGVPHSSPPALVTRVNGRPRATSTQVNERVGCGAAPYDAEERVLDASGAVVDPFPPTAALPCDTAGIYGRWDIRVRVDGVLSDPAEIVYFNSGCPGISTCAMARATCVP